MNVVDLRSDAGGAAAPVGARAVRVMESIGLPLPLFIAVASGSLRSGNNSLSARHPRHKWFHSLFLFRPFPSLPPRSALPPVRSSLYGAH